MKSLGIQDWIRSSITKFSFFYFFIFIPNSSWAAFSNYNTILIGEHAAGLGGAYTALYQDPSAAPFYNPGSTARALGSSLSASINLYNKYSTEFSQLDGFEDAPLKVNQGSIVPLPSSSGLFYSFGHFALGLSIVVPDSETYDGLVSSTKTSRSSLTISDESLWVGGNIAVNLTEDTSVGLTMYYTSRTYSRKVTNEFTVGADTTLVSEDKSYFHNGLIYAWGVYHQLTPRWSLGASYRFESLPVSSRGTYFQSELSTATGAITPIKESDLTAFTKVPAKAAIGIAYQVPRLVTFAFDLTYHAPTSFADTIKGPGSDPYEHRGVLNAHFGAEVYTYPWLAIRGGLFTNFSAAKDIPQQPNHRQLDRIQMWGFSNNVAIHTSDQTTFTLGGYYTGGKGHSVQLVDKKLSRVPKSHQVFSFLVGTSHHF